MLTNIEADRPLPYPHPDICSGLIP